MRINFLSQADEASFSEMKHSGSELAEIFSSFSVQLGMETDYSELMLSFDSEDILRIEIEDSPYTVILNELHQVILLEQEGRSDTVEEVFDEDGIESLVDIISSRILSDEDYGF